MRDEMVHLEMMSRSKVFEFLSVNMGDMKSLQLVVKCTHYPLTIHSLSTHYAPLAPCHPCRILMYSNNRYYGRSISKPEIGCCLSHLGTPQLSIDTALHHSLSRCSCMEPIGRAVY